MANSLPISGIYKISNTKTGKIYIGSSVDINRRFREHKSQLIHNRHRNSYLQRSWNANGENSFEFSILEIVESAFLIEKEQYYLDLFKSYNKTVGYNQSPTAGNTLGFRLTLLQKEKMRKPKSMEHRSALSKAKKGIKFSKTHLENLRSKVRRGKESNFYGISYMSGKTRTQEVREKISKANSGPNSPNFGKPAFNRRKVIQFDLNGNQIKEWDSITVASNELNILRTSIVHTCTGRQKTCGGFIWKYK